MSTLKLTLAILLCTHFIVNEFKKHWPYCVRSVIFRPGHFFERFKLLLVDEVELGDEVVEVLVARVHVRLSADGHHLKRRAVIQVIGL